MLITLNHSFDKLCEQLNSGRLADEEKEKLSLEVQNLAEMTKNHIIAIQGPKSDKLIEIYCLYSFFAFQSGDVAQGMAYQKQST